VTEKPTVTGIRIKKAVWVKPKYFAEVEYQDITADGQLRHSSFEGISTKR
jgi:bifunctional non-homologous end joining protein LigD